MPAKKIAVTVDERLLHDVDDWVAHGEYPSRSRVIQTALARLKDDRDRRGRLVHELAKLDPGEECRLADEALDADVQWPEY